MAATLRIEVAEQPVASVVHRFRNFGEDVFRELGETYSIDLDEIDQANTSFTLAKVPARKVGQVTEQLMRAARRHGFGSSLRVTRI